MKGKIESMNTTDGEYFILMFWDGEEWRVSYYAPNNWKTRKGAERWALKHGYEL